MEQTPACPVEEDSSAISQWRVPHERGREHGREGSVAPEDCVRRATQAGAQHTQTRVDETMGEHMMLAGGKVKNNAQLSQISW